MQTKRETEVGRSSPDLLPNSWKLCQVEAGSLKILLVVPNEYRVPST